MVTHVKQLVGIGPPIDARRLYSVISLCSPVTALMLAASRGPTKYIIVPKGDRLAVV